MQISLDQRLDQLGSAFCRCSKVSILHGRCCNLAWISLWIGLDQLGSDGRGMSALTFLLFAQRVPRMSTSPRCCHVVEQFPQAHTRTLSPPKSPTSGAQKWPQSNLNLGPVPACNRRGRVQVKIYPGPRRQGGFPLPPPTAQVARTRHTV